MGRDLLYASAGLSALLFGLMLLDRDTGRAITAANYLIQQKRRGFFRGLRLRDPEWGFFGSALHDRRTMWCNRVLFVEFFVSMAVGNRHQPPVPLLLALVGFWLTTLMLILKLKVVVDPNGPKPSAI